MAVCACAFCDEEVPMPGTECVFCARVCARPWPSFTDMARWCLHRMKAVAELEGSLPAHVAVDAEMNGTAEHVVKLTMEERALRARFKEQCEDESS